MNKLAIAIAFLVGIPVGAAACVYLRPHNSGDQLEAMARALRLAEAEHDRCEAELNRKESLR